MADKPDFIMIGRDRDLEGRRNDIWVRRAILAVLGVIPLLALFNVFGQRARTSQAAAPSATLEVDAPTKVRAGLLYSARITVRANETLDDATLVFDSNWIEGMTLNTLEPSPVSETSQNGSLRFELGTIEAGQQYELILAFQVNPTTVSNRDQGLELLDGDQRIITLHRSMTVYP